MLVLLITFGLELVSSTYNNAILDVDIRKAANVHSLGFLISGGQAQRLGDCSWQERLLDL